MGDVYNQSILETIKKLLGIMPTYTQFDQDLIVCINSAFSILKQLGVGPSEGFHIAGNQEKWGDYMDEEDNTDTVISYIHLKVKLMFDPPSNSFITEAFNKTISEIEWRLTVGNK